VVLIKKTRLIDELEVPEYPLQKQGFSAEQKKDMLLAFLALICFVGLFFLKPAATGMAAQNEINIDCNTTACLECRYENNGCSIPEIEIPVNMM